MGRLLRIAVKSCQQCWCVVSSCTLGWGILGDIFVQIFIIELSVIFIGQTFQNVENVSVTDGLPGKRIEKLNNSEKKTC